ncbi:cupin-like domain-containing protein [Aurantiacibacter gilvus]|uniref:Cupin-like domain-containing protein n=1 Tax=Aurantiacibacter gilvus TaxID=3139141 RepID=A0ABU9ICH0_9SPHN
MSDKRQIVAQAVMDGADIRERLLASGMTPAAVDYEIKRAEADPVVIAAQRLRRQLAKRDWTLQLQGRLAGTRADGLTIPTVANIEPQRFIDEFYAANRPVVLTGLVDHWPALAKWTLDYLDSVVGDALVELQAERGSAADYEQAKDRHKRGAQFRTVTSAMRRVESSNQFYITAYNDTNNKVALAKLWDDLGPVSILRKSGGRDGFFWMGPKGTLTPFHHDLTNNLLVQVMGRKKSHLVPSWEVGRMKNSKHCFSDRSPADWDTNDANLPPMLECTIGPGDALFLPIGWWHHVEALDHSISMSFTNFAADNGFFEDYPPDTRF